MFDGIATASTQAAAAPTTGCRCKHTNPQHSESTHGHQRPCDEAPCSAKIFRAQHIVLSAYAQPTAPTLWSLGFAVATDLQEPWTVVTKFDARRASLFETSLFTPCASARELLRTLSIMRC